MNTYCVGMLLLLLHCSCETTLGQTLNVTGILEKAGQFTTLIRLLRSTQMESQINSQLKNSNNGLTLFAPTDAAFSSLSPGTLNSLTDQQKVELVQYHVLPTLVPPSQFQTVSNPVRTLAGDARGGGYPLNVSSAGSGQVNISTGVVNATVSNAIFSDGQLAVYPVEKVLLPLRLFGPAAAPAPAPSSSTTPKGSLPNSKDGPPKAAVQASSTAARLGRMGFGGFAALALLLIGFLSWWEL
uniref:Fasciclin-like arabinogalactan protein 11 n=1 Tax=Anthurium amnicola TaxID=1678845 RepID=A0A1D1Y7H0_9ARAE